MSRLTIDLTGEQHQQIKAIAAMQGKSIREYVIERIFPADDQEEKAWNELKLLLNSRISEAETRGVSRNTIQQVAQEALQEADQAR